MNKAFLHIGTEKTATTSLQHFFFTNREKLLENNIFFPSIPGKLNHEKLSIYAAPERVINIRIKHDLLEKQKLYTFKSGFVNALRKETQPYSDKHILFSNEHLSSRVVEPSQIATLKVLIDDLGYDPYIIVYLRRQDQMLVSSYSTRIKSGGIEDFSLQTNTARYNYFDFLTKWATVFGREKIIVRPFEKSQWIGGTIFNDFTTTIGLPAINDFVLPSKKSNKSLDRAQIKFLTLFNKELKDLPRPEATAIKANLVKLLESNSSNDGIILSKTTAKQFLEQYESQNSQVAKVFLGRQDGRLFKEEFNLGEENLLPELTVEQAVKIATYLWSKKQQHIASQREVLMKLKSLIP